MCQLVCQEVCVHYGEVCAFISEWVGVASRKPEGFGTCARPRSIGVSLHSFDFTPPCFSFQFICSGWFRFWARNVDLYFTLRFSSFFFFHAHFFFSPARNTEKVGGAALRSVPHSLWLVRSHSHTHSLPFCHCHLGRRETVLFPATLTAGESTALTLLEPGHDKEYNFSSRSRKDPRGGGKETVRKSAITGFMLAVIT